MDGFTMDGYKDLDALAEDMWAKGATLCAKDKRQLKQFVACVLHEALVQVNTQGINRDRTLQAVEFYNGCWGIVDCAQKDELI
jgi:hypothetical protein